MHDSVPQRPSRRARGTRSCASPSMRNLGGQAPCYLVGLAAMAVATGQASNVLVFRALNGRSGQRVGTMQFAGDGRPVPLPDRLRRLPHVRGDVGAAVPARDGAGRATTSLPSPSRSARTRRRTSGRTSADRSLLRSTWPSPFVVEPFRASDCTVEVDGACAVLVTSLESARDLRHPPAVVASSAYRAGPDRGLDIGDHLLWDDYTRNYTSLLRDELFGRAGHRPRRRGGRRDLRLLHEHGAHRPRRARHLRAGRVGRIRAVGRHGARRAASDQHPRRSARRGLPARHEHRRPRRCCRCRAEAGARQAPRHECRGRHVGGAHGRLGARAHE